MFYRERLPTKLNSSSIDRCYWSSIEMQHKLPATDVPMATGIDGLTCPTRHLIFNDSTFRRQMESIGILHKYFRFKCVRYQNLHQHHHQQPIMSRSSLCRKFEKPWVLLHTGLIRYTWLISSCGRILDIMINWKEKKLLECRF